MILVITDALGNRKIVASKHFKPGQIILSLKNGITIEQATKYSVQIDWKQHIDAPEEERWWLAFKYPWCFTNHHCHPNAYFQGIHLVALYHIGVKEEITFDYNTTEYDMDCPFECCCNAHKKPRLISGFKHLSSKEQSQLR
ncbi:hypothetical protein QUF54_05475, partial [Candidatus Marithioploca araucensis]|nr:hypothetical protein [Candidatus Marithioploca araucensis]